MSPRRCACCGEACPPLLDLGRGPSAENFYGSSQLAHAAVYGIGSRGGLSAL